MLYNCPRRQFGKMYQKLFFKGIPLDLIIPFPNMYFKATRIHERFSCNDEDLFINVKNWKQHKCLK